MRDPSIHITISQFRELLETFGEVNDRNICRFFRAASTIACSNRAVIPTNQKVRKKAKAVTQGTLEDATTLAGVIYAVRQQAKHIGVQMIKPLDTQWVSVKQLVSILNSWAEQTKRDKRQAYVEFVTEGLALLSKNKRNNFNFMASNLVSRASQVFNLLQEKAELKSDNNVNGTKELHDLYVSQVAEITGIYQRYDKDPSIMAHFKAARESADELGAPYETYIQAQFYALAFCNGIPAPRDLYGDKGTSRLIKYLSETGETLKPKTTKSVNWEAFK